MSVMSKEPPTGTSDSARSSAAVSSRKLKFGFARFSGFYIGALFIVVYGVITPDVFLTSTTLHTVAYEEAIAAMLGLAVLIPLVAQSFDLSVGAVANFSGILAVVLLNERGTSVPVAVATSVGVAATIGFLNGLLIVKLKIDSFIATLGSSAVILALQMIISRQQQPLPPETSGWEALTRTNVFGFQIVVVYLFILAFAAWWMLERTPMGRYLYAIGGNAEAARLSGVQVDKWVWISHITSSAIAGFAGVMYTSQSGPSLTFGATLLLPAFAAVFLGSTQIYPGRFNVWGAIVAIYVLAIGVKGLQLLTAVTWLNEMFNGIALITAVAVASWPQHAERRRIMKGRASRNKEQPASGATALE